MCVLVAATALLWAGAGCATTGDDGDDGATHSEMRQQIEEEFGALTDEQIDSFERELAAQYRQLELTYRDYDRLRGASPEEVEQNHDEHRTHRRLKRRHQTIARLHEDRLWLFAAEGESSSSDRHLSEAHRAAARWHEKRFDEDGQGIVEQDSELEVLRHSLHEAQPAGVEVTIVPAADR